MGNPQEGLKEESELIQQARKVGPAGVEAEERARKKLIEALLAEDI